jgi:hypothetical protein
VIEQHRHPCIIAATLHEAISKQQITAEGKAHTDEKAQQP